ncbi:hypothetical protein ACR6C2_39970 [Streptomyces sp. INA 01156]
MRFLYRHHDPRSNRSKRRPIWKIAPGERGSRWDECRKGRFICVGWDALGDLGQYQNDTELRAALDRHWSGKNGGSLTLARRLLAFRDLETGDRIVANRGTDEVLATGTVTDSYRFVPIAPSSNTSYRSSGTPPTHRGWTGRSTAGGPPSPRSIRLCSPSSPRPGRRIWP